jgi:antitoxin ParD1/3/4
MNISLDPKLERFIQEKVQSGQYASASDVVNCALWHFQAQESPTAEEIAELKREVAIGIEQLNRGESAPWDPEEIKAKGRQIIEERRRRDRGHNV